MPVASQLFLCTLRQFLKRVAKQDEPHLQSKADTNCHCCARSTPDRLVCGQVTAREAVLVATAQPITKDVADSLAHTVAIHSKSFAKRRHETSIPLC